MIIFFLLAVNIAAIVLIEGKSTVPFTYSLDQSIPCPVGCGQDYDWIEDVRENQTPDLNVDWVQEYLDEQIKKLGSPSAGIVVNLRGERVASIYSGKAKLNTERPKKPDENSVFLIASITKTFATTSLFQMRDRGLLPMGGLDTPVKELLPEFSIRSPYSSKRPITLRSLAMQTSGLPREIPPYEPDPKNASETERRVLNAVKNLTVLSSMYMSPHYSNLGLALLGRAIEKVTNTTWETYLQENILRPLGMTSTGNPADFTSDVRSRVIDGVAVPNASVPVHISETNSWGGACGSMHSSFSDMSVWMNFLMDVGDENDKELFASVLDPATRAEMRNTGFVMGDGISAVSSGVFERAYMQNSRWTENKLGCVQGYRSDMTLVSSLGLNVFGVTTSTCDLYGDGDAIVFPVVSRLIQDLEKKLKTLDSTRPPAPQAKAILGTYHCESGDIIIDMENNTVVSRNVDGEPYSFVLKYIADASDEYGPGATMWRRIMGPEAWLSDTIPACRDMELSSTNHGLCPISCMRKMARGSGDLTFFFKADDLNIVMSTPGSGETCRHI